MREVQNPPRIAADFFWFGDRSEARIIFSIGHYIEERSLVGAAKAAVPLSG
jgi:hypothetical protein